MTDSDPGNNRYQLELDAAVEMFDNGDMDKCLAAAKKNLTYIQPSIHENQRTNVKQ